MEGNGMGWDGMEWNGLVPPSSPVHPGGSGRGLACAGHGSGFEPVIPAARLSPRQWARARARAPTCGLGGGEAWTVAALPQTPEDEHGASEGKFAGGGSERR
eukprot:scaffold3202_cov407-Prasinococcus_capsulatus_cf.AAC.1